MSETYTVDQVDDVLALIIESHDGVGKVPSLRKIRNSFLSSGAVDVQALTPYELTLGFAYAFEGIDLGFWLDWKEREGLSETSRLIENQRLEVLKKHGVPFLTGSQFGWHGDVADRHDVHVGLAVFDRWLAQYSGNADVGVPTLRLLNIQTGGDFYAAVTCGEAWVGRLIESFAALGIKAELATELYPGTEVTARHMQRGWLEKMFDLQEWAGSVLADVHEFEPAVVDSIDVEWLQAKELRVWQRSIADGVLVKIALQPTRAPNPNGQITQVSPVIVVERDDLNERWAEITAGTRPGDRQTINDRTDTRFTLHRYADNLRDAEGFYHKNSSREVRMKTEAAWFEKHFAKTIKSAKSVSYAKRRLTKNSKAFQKKRPGGWVDVDGVLLAVLAGEWDDGADRRFLSHGEALVDSGKADPWVSEWIQGIRTWVQANPEGLVNW